MNCVGRNLIPKTARLVKVAAFCLFITNSAADMLGAGATTRPKANYHARSVLQSFGAVFFAADGSRTNACALSVARRRAHFVPATNLGEGKHMKKILF
jgi:hypothetical protein